MKIVRSHIARLYGFLLLFIGIALHTLSPGQEKENHSAFTSWLSSQLKSEDADVQEKLEALAATEEALDTVIRKASELVKTHSDDFKLPISEGESSEEQVYNVLLSQWNAFQHAGNGMAKAVLIEQGKAQVILPTDGKYFKTNFTHNEQKFNSSIEAQELRSDEISAQSHTLSPFKSGIAIGAP